MRLVPYVLVVVLVVLQLEGVLTTMITGCTASSSLIKGDLGAERVTE
jgi:hypothetical protein